MAQTLITQHFGPEQTPVSRIALGCMGMAGTWNPADVGPENIRKAILAFEAALECGITFFDHADIYGGGACESVFKSCLEAVPGSREKIFIATKAGIKAGFNHSPEHLRYSIRASLDRMGLDYIDLYQMHRPDPLSHPAETAATLDSFVEEGLIRTVGVSNYHVQQVLALKKYLKAPLVSNQIEISLLHLEPIYEGTQGQGGDGSLDQCLELDITPLAWSPLGGGWLSGRRELRNDHHNYARIDGTLKLLRELGPKYGDATPGQLAIAWLLKHPAKIIPLVGSNNPEHIREAVAAANIDITREDWMNLWTAGRAQGLP